MSSGFIYLYWRNTMNHKNKRKGFQPSRMRCPYCGAPVVFRSADGIYKDNHLNAMLYVCSKYPKCDAYVRVHEGTKIPVGTLANKELRNLRRTAHLYFDQLYQSGLMTKDAAYQWLSDMLCTPPSEAHIGRLGEYYCKEVIRESKKLLERRKAVPQRRFPVLLEGGAAAS